MQAARRKEQAMAELVGTEDAEILIGGEDQDMLAGGPGGDILEGGAGVDVFVVGDGDSPAGEGLDDPDAYDIVTDFTPEDRLLFPGAAPPVMGSLWPGVAEDYESAFSLAQTAFDKGFEYASIKVGADVFVFALRVDSVVKLEGVDWSKIGSNQITYGTPEDGLVEHGGPGDEARTFAAGADWYDAGAGDDTVQGGEGGDTLLSGQGDDRVFAGDGDDSVEDGEGGNYLRGEAGDDIVTGGDDHDDINGNMGRDTLQAGAGDDWVRGGKDDDIVFAGEGDDLAFGDLGSDTVGGGLGDDVVRGGDGGDVLRGDDGDDTLVGDAGADTLDGGIGADLIVLTEDAGADRVLGFNAAEGDRVRIDGASDYEVRQLDNGTLIETADGRTLILEGVQVANLPPGWLVAA
jgi:Ca2+-binding RTX toxin-like protein